MKLYPHQENCLRDLEGLNRVAIYYDMGLGKTYIGSEKMKQLHCQANLVICQKSKVKDWVGHFTEHYATDFLVFDLTRKGGLEAFIHDVTEDPWTEVVGVINYDLIFRRPELTKALKDFTLMLDESSLICNEHAKRSKAILKMNPRNVILLSGTPTAGKYEKLWSQCRLLGWDIRKEVFWRSYVESTWIDCGGFRRQVVTGYKHVEHLKKKLREHGAAFLKTEEVLDLPEQVPQEIMVQRSAAYKKFMKSGYIVLKDGTEMIGGNALTKILYARQLCGQYSNEKLDAFRDLINSTGENLVVFYNFNGELEALRKIAAEEGRTVGEINGHKKDPVEGKSILLFQYQAGAYGLNLQGFSRRVIYYTLPLGKGSCDMWEQSKKRIHRIGQDKTCFYYYLLVQDSIEIKNLGALKEGMDYTNDLFELGGASGGRKEL